MGRVGTPRARPGVARQVHRAELTDLRREDEDAVGVLGDDHLRVHAVDLERAVRAVDGHARRRRRGTGRGARGDAREGCAPNAPRPRLALTSREVETGAHFDESRPARARAPHHWLNRRVTSSCELVVGGGRQLPDGAAG